LKSGYAFNTAALKKLNNYLSRNKINLSGAQKMAARFEGNKSDFGKKQENAGQTESNRRAKFRASIKAPAKRTMEQNPGIQAAQANLDTAQKEYKDYLAKTKKMREPSSGNRVSETVARLSSILKPTLEKTFSKKLFEKFTSTSTAGVGAVADDEGVTRNRMDIQGRTATYSRFSRAQIDAEYKKLQGEEGAANRTAYGEETYDGMGESRWIEAKVGIEKQQAENALKRVALLKASLKVSDAHLAADEEHKKAMDKLKDAAAERLEFIQDSITQNENITQLLGLFRQVQLKMADKKLINAAQEILQTSVSFGDPKQLRDNAESKYRSGISSISSLDPAERKRISEDSVKLGALRNKVNTAGGDELFQQFMMRDMGMDFDEDKLKKLGPLEYAIELFGDLGEEGQKAIEEIMNKMAEHGKDKFDLRGDFRGRDRAKSVREFNRELEFAEKGLSTLAQVQAVVNKRIATYVALGGQLSKEEIQKGNKQVQSSTLAEFDRELGVISKKGYSAQVILQKLGDNISKLVQNPETKKGTIGKDRIEQIRKANKAATRDFGRQFEVTKELFEGGAVSVDVLRSSLAQFNEKAMQTGDYGFENFLSSIKDEFTYTNADFYKDIDQMGREFARDFKSGTASAFGEAIKGTKDLKQAFSEMFGTMADKMLDKSLNMATNAAFGAMGFKGMNKGGPVKGYSGGGSVVGGSGTKDDVPAYLSRGEYVIRRRAVSEYGKQFFDSLNGGKVIAAASGGGVGDKLSKGSAAQIFGGKTRNAAAIEAERTKRLNALSSAGIASYGYKESTGDTKEDWLGRKTSQKILASKVGFKLDFGKPLNEQRIKKIQDAVNSYPEIGPFIDPDIFKRSTVQIGRGATKAKFKNSFIYNETKRPDAGKFNIDPRLSSLALNDEDNPQNKYKFSKADEFFGYQKDRLEYYADKQKELQDFQDKKAARRTSFLFGAGAMLLAGSAGGGKSKGFAKGGINQEDDIPALLTGGEYVMRKGIVDKYGMSFFENLNRGRISAFNSGGYVAPITGAKPTTEYQLSKGGKSSGGVSNTNNINISVNVDGNGAVTAESDERGASSTNPASQEEAKILADRVKSAVVEVITNEKRPGGMLYGTRGSV
jgi:hypothetical protein